MRVRRTDWTDWYVDGGESAVLAGGNVVVLSELATALVAAVPPDGEHVVRLAEVLVATFGRPGDGDDGTRATTTAVRDLVASGVLEPVR